PVPGGADRRRRRRGEDRRPGGDDLPAAVHLGRDPRLLLEGPARQGRLSTGTAMGSHGIKDRVAIVGMGCTAFGERFDTGLDDLPTAASTRAFGAAGVDKETVDAYWFGTAQSGMSGMALAKPLQLEGKPVTRIENYCATGSEALRQAAYAVASGAYDVAMA